MGGGGGYNGKDPVNDSSHCSQAFVLFVVRLYISRDNMATELGFNAKRTVAVQ